MKVPRDEALARAAAAERPLTNREIAQVALAMADRLYRPSAAAAAFVEAQQAQQPNADPAALRAEYVRRLNLILWDQLSPVTMAEVRPVPAGAAEHACPDCRARFPLNTIRIVGAKNPEDLSVALRPAAETAEAAEGTAPAANQQPAVSEITIVVAEQPQDTVLDEAITTADLHNLAKHPGTEDTTRAVETLFQFADYQEGNVNLTHPFYWGSSPS